MKQDKPAGNPTIKYYLHDGFKKIRLVHRETLLGRDEALMIRVDDPAVSKHHAKIDLGANNADPTLM